MRATNCIASVFIVLTIFFSTHALSNDESPAYSSAPKEDEIIRIKFSGIDRYGAILGQMYSFDDLAHSALPDEWEMLDEPIHGRMDVASSSMRAAVEQHETGIELVIYAIIAGVAVHAINQLMEWAWSEAFPAEGASVLIYSCPPTEVRFMDPKRSMIESYNTKAMMICKR